MSTRVLVVDHFDSFAFILGEQFARLGAQVSTLRCHLGLSDLEDVLAELRPHLVVLSPGPGRPEDTGVTLPWLRTGPAVPVLGICLGHQAMTVAAGGEVDRAPRPVHGMAGTIELVDDPLFAGLPRRFPAARYHSLVATRVPRDLQVLGSCRENDVDLVMAVRHRRQPWLGFQFHPESFLTPWGGRLVERALERATAGGPPEKVFHPDSPDTP